MLRKLNYLLSTRGILGHYLNMLPPPPTPPPTRVIQVLLNNRLTRLGIFRSECANTSLVGTTNPTPNLLLHWRWKPSMTGVSIFAGILLARYLLLIDSQLGLLPLFRIPSCNSGEVMLSNHFGTRLSGSNLAPPIHGQSAQFMISFSLPPSAITFRPWSWHLILPFFPFMYVYIYLRL